MSTMKHQNGGDLVSETIERGGDLLNVHNENIHLLKIILTQTKWYPIQDRAIEVSALSLDRWGYRTYNSVDRYLLSKAR